MIVRYSYERIPTVRQFTLSNKRWRCIIGPFGSSKSSGCVMDIIQKSLNQHPSPKDGIRKTRWAVVRNCFSDDTEILTEENGWRLFKDLSPDDKVAQYNPTTGRLEFVKPTYYFKAHYKGVMIGIKSNSIDLLTTPDHKHYVSTRHTRKKVWSDYHFEHAINLYGKETVKFKITAPQEGYRPTNYSLDFFEFLGFYFAEGYSGKYKRKDYDGYHYRLVLTQKKYPEYVRDLLRRNNFAFTEFYRENGINFVLSINDKIKELINKLSKLGKAKTKFIPNWIRKAAPEYLKAFLFGYQMGDGSFKNNKRNSDKLYTPSKLLANDLQEIALRAGIPATICSEKNRENYVVILLQPCRHYPTARKKMWYKQEYSGWIYCVEVPTHIVLVRRNGKACLSSQTFRMLRDTTIKTFLDWFPPSKFGNYKISTHDYIIDKFPNTRIEIMFRALDKPEDVSNLLSLELTGAWLNEAREIPEEIFYALDGRIGRYPSIRDGGATWSGIILDTNPPDEEHWIYRIFEEEKPSHAAIFKQPSGLSPQAENLMTPEEWEGVQKGLINPDDVPAGLPPDYYIKLAEGKPQDFIDVYVHGKYATIKAGKPIFDRTFNPTIHIAKTEIKPIHGLPIILGMDFGLTPAAAFMQLTPIGRLIVFDELYEEGIGIDQFTTTLLKPYLTSYYSGFSFKIIGDPAGMQRSQTDEKTCFEILREHNFDVRPAKSNAISLRINSLEFFLTKLVDGLPAFQLSPKCTMIKKGFISKYCWRKKRDGSYTQEIEKNKWSHIMDALGYGASFFYQDSKKKKFFIPRQTRRPASLIAGY